jgi:uncharacterized membrane protein
MHPIHPMIVHFPIALLMVAVMFEVLAMRWRTRSFLDASLYTLVAGLVGAGLAIITGGLAEEGLEEFTIPDGLLDLHEGLGYATFGIFVGILALRVLMRRRWLQERPALTIGLGVIGIGVLAVTGYYGGSLVYDFGAGVTQITAVSEP